MGVDVGPKTDKRSYRGEDLMVSSELNWLRGYFMDHDERTTRKLDKAIRYEQEMRDRYYNLRELFRHEPYQGLQYKILCSNCSGRGEVNGRNSDDPRWVECPICKGDGLTPQAREALG